MLYEKRNMKPEKINLMLENICMNSLSTGDEKGI